jgi:hypothetical protein
MLGAAIAAPAAAAVDADFRKLRRALAGDAAEEASAERGLWMAMKCLQKYSRLEINLESL